MVSRYGNKEFINMLVSCLLFNCYNKKDEEEEEEKSLYFLCLTLTRTAFSGLLACCFKLHLVADSVFRKSMPERIFSLHFQPYINNGGVLFP